MSFPILIGVETEYGIAAHRDKDWNPFHWCERLLQWNPLLLEGAVPHSDVIAVTPPTIEYPDWMLANGARLYIDHGHPEYSTPECQAIRELVAADKAGELILNRLRGALPIDEATSLGLYKNNADYRSNSYGCHENYLLDASFYEALLDERGELWTKALIPFLITRMLYCGAGKVGGENATAPAGFQLWQRADFFESLRGVQTTYARPIVNLRDEPHADRHIHRRLHVIAGDANLSEVSLFLKAGTMRLFLRALQQGAISRDWSLADPLEAARFVSRDLSFSRPLRLASGTVKTALRIQREMLADIWRFLRKSNASSEDVEIASRWSGVLDDLNHDWAPLATSLDWAIKLRLLNRILSGRNLTWESTAAWQPFVECASAAKLDLESFHTPGEFLRAAMGAGFAEEGLEDHFQKYKLDWGTRALQYSAYFSLRKNDLSYHEISRGDLPGPEAGLYYQLYKRSLLDTILPQENAERAVFHPPAGRAAARSVVVRQSGGQVRWADWGRICVGGTKDGDPPAVITIGFQNC